MPPPLFSGRIPPNATATLENVTYSVDADGGTVETYSELSAGVLGLVSRVSGNRDGRFGTDLNAVSCTFTTDDEDAARQDIRITFTDGPAAVTGRTFYVNGITERPAGVGGLLAAGYTLQLSTIHYPS